MTADPSPTTPLTDDELARVRACVDRAQAAVDRVRFAKNQQRAAARLAVECQPLIAAMSPLTVARMLAELEAGRRQRAASGAPPTLPTL